MTRDLVKVPRRIDLVEVSRAARIQMERLCKALGVEPDPIRPTPRTRWQRVRAWFADRPLRYPWLLRVETWILEKLGKRPRACVTVARKLNVLVEAVRHEADDLVRRAERALADERRYLGFCGQSTPAGTPVEVRMADGERRSMEVDDVGIEHVRVRDMVTGELEIHEWFNVRRIRRPGDALDVQVPAPIFNSAGDLVPALYGGKEAPRLAAPPQPKEEDSCE